MASDHRVETLQQWCHGQSWRLALLHNLPEHVILFVTRGQGRLLLNGTMRGVGTHNLLTIPPGNAFALDLMRQGSGWIAAVPAESSLTLPQRARQLRLRDAGDIGTITQLFDACLREDREARPLAREAIAAHMSLMSVALRRLIAAPEHLPQPQSAAARLSEGLFRSLASHKGAPLTMADHAAMLGVTPTHLSRVAKASTGKTAANLMADHTLHAARIALADTSVPIADIARHLGFGSAAYFTRFMRSQTGQTPSALRRLDRRISA